MTDVFATYLLRNQNQLTLELLQEAFPDNDHIHENVGQMVSKKKLWKEKLELQWTNRRRPLYTQWDVRATNYQFKLAQEQGENLLTAQNMFQGTGASERAWVINSRPSRGWDPYLGEYMQWSLEFEEVPK